MSDSPVVYTPAQVAERTGISETRVRAVVRKECEAHVPDELRMIPGGRFDEKVMLIYRGIFDAVISGRAVTRTAPVSVTDAASFIHRVAS